MPYDRVLFSCSWDCSVKKPWRASSSRMRTCPRGLGFCNISAALDAIDGDDFFFAELSLTKRSASAAGL